MSKVRLSFESKQVSWICLGQQVKLLIRQAILFHASEKRRPGEGVDGHPALSATTR